MRFGTTNAVVGVIACSCYVAGCGGSATALGLTGAVPQNDLAATVPIVLRNPAGSGSEFLPEQLGSDFTLDLPNSHFASSGNFAVLTPAWAGSGNKQATDAAFAIYALDLDGALPVAELSLSWAGVAPPSDCWAGMPNWASQAWEWAQLPGSGVLTVASPAQ